MDDFEDRLRRGLSADLEHVPLEGTWAGMERPLRRVPRHRPALVLAVALVVVAAAVGLPRLLSHAPSRQVTVGPGPAPSASAEPTSSEIEATRSIPRLASTYGLVAAGAPDGDGRSRSIALIDSASGEAVYELPGWSTVSLEAVAWSPDGARLLYRSEGAEAYRVADFGRGMDAAIIVGGMVQLDVDPVWQDSTHLLVPCTDSVVTLDVETMQPVRTLRLPGPTETELAPMGIAVNTLGPPEGTADRVPRLAVTTGNRRTGGAAVPMSDRYATLLVWDAAAGRPRELRSPPGIDLCTDPVFTSDAVTVAVVCAPFVDEDSVYGTSVWLVDSGAGRWTKLLDSSDVGPTGHVRRVRAAADGGFILQWSGECEIPATYHAEADGTGVRELFPDWVASTFGAFSPDGGRMVVEAATDCGAESTIVVAAADGTGQRVLAKGTNPVWSPAGP
jgi:hypothetical protein